LGVDLGFKGQADFCIDGNNGQHLADEPAAQIEAETDFQAQGGPYEMRSWIFEVDAASNASVPDRQQVLRLVVREVLVGTDSVVIQHTIPRLDPGGRSTCHLWGNRRGGNPPPGRNQKNLGLPRPAFETAAGCFRFS
jgi:hypothetical protein